MGFSRQADEQANHRYKLINVTLAAYRGGQDHPMSRKIIKTDVISDIYLLIGFIG